MQLNKLIVTLHDPVILQTDENMPPLYFHSLVHEQTKNFIAVKDMFKSSVAKLASRWIQDKANKSHLFTTEIRLVQSSRKLTSPTPEATRFFVGLVNVAQKLYSGLVKFVSVPVVHKSFHEDC